MDTNKHPALNLELVVTSPITYTPPTAEQKAKYRESMRKMHGGTAWPGFLLDEGEITAEEARAMLKEARIQRKLRKVRNKKLKAGF